MVGCGGKGLWWGVTVSCGAGGSEILKWVFYFVFFYIVSYFNVILIFVYIILMYKIEK